MKVTGLAPDPFEKFRERRLRPESRDRVEPSGEFGFGKTGMDGAVADLMEDHCFALGSAFKLGNQMMSARLRVAWNRAIAKRTDKIHRDIDP